MGRWDNKRLANRNRNGNTWFKFLIWNIHSKQILIKIYTPRIIFIPSCTCFIKKKSKYTFFVQLIQNWNDRLVQHCVQLNLNKTKLLQPILMKRAWLLPVTVICTTKQFKRLACSQSTMSCTMKSLHISVDPACFAKSNIDNAIVHHLWVRSWRRLLKTMNEVTKYIVIMFKKRINIVLHFSKKSCEEGVFDDMVM